MISLFDMTPTDEIVISPEALLIKEFEVIWERDKIEGHKQAKKELTFVWGMADPTERNIWRDFKDTLQRGKIIREDLFGKDSKWKPDADVIKAVDKYKSRIPRSALDAMLESVEGAITKLSDYLDTVDFSQTDAQGKLIHDPKKVRDIISTMGKTVADYNELKKQVEAGKVGTDEQIRGGGTRGYMETTETFKDLQ
jgi:hypothetical protein